MNNYKAKQNKKHLHMPLTTASPETLVKHIQDLYAQNYKMAEEGNRRRLK